jgi:hypothetical protein
LDKRLPNKLPTRRSAGTEDDDPHALYRPSSLL